MAQMVSLIVLQLPESMTSLLIDVVNSQMTKSILQMSDQVTDFVITVFCPL